MTKTQSKPQAQLPAALDPDNDKLPEQVRARGINEAQWRTLKNNLYPGARSNSVLMVIDYCAARGLDPMKKPCHIVPMKVKDAQTGIEEWRDVVMPGIYEIRTTAHRTGEYLGSAAPVYGGPQTFGGVEAPAWCDFTVYRWNPKAGIRAEFTVRTRFDEVCATKSDGLANGRWTKAPFQMLTKCAEAAALRAAFPDELGGEHTVEEMEDRMIGAIDGHAERVGSGKAGVAMPQRLAVAGPQPVDGNGSPVAVDPFVADLEAAERRAEAARDPDAGADAGAGAGAQE